MQPRQATAEALDRAIGQYGFRITDHAVESDGARPRICATFAGQLEPGRDYAPFVSLPAPGLSVEAQDSRICIGGLEHGARYRIGFRAGLPSAGPEVLAKGVEIEAYVRDRTPQVRFPGRAYVLPRTGEVALPVVTVNTEALDLRLSRISDRNIIRAIQNDWFGQPIPPYAEEEFADQIGEQIWQGTATVAMEVNRDMQARLPLAAAGPLAPGVYALRAAVPGADADRSPPATQWFVVSDLGLTSLSGSEGIDVFVRSLGTAEPRAGVAVALLSRSNRVLGEAATDAQGHARFPAALARGTGGAAPALITAVAEAGAGAQDLSFLSLTDPEFDLSDRGVEGREPPPPVDVFLATDRGVYRAGEVVNATALARDGQARAIPGLPLTAVLRRPDGVEYARAVAPDAGAGGHVWALPVGGQAPRGLWRLDVLAEPEAPPLASRTFLVEDFLPERIELRLDLPERLALGEDAEAGLSARYLFGPPAGDLAVEGEVTLRAADGLAAFPGFRFGLVGERFDPRAEPLPSGLRTDAEGRAAVPLRLPAIPDPGRPLEALVTLRVAEGSGRPVERRELRPVGTERAMLGLRPLFDGALGEGQEAAFEAVSTQGELPVAWVLDRVETDYQWYQMWGRWNWEPVTTRVRVAEGEGVAGGLAAPLRIAAPVGWGHYELRVEPADGAPGAASVAFDAGWYAGADVSATPDMLEIALDKPAYRPGDTARLRLVPRAAGVALVTVVSDHLVAMQAVEVPAGESFVDLPVTAEWGTGAYVAVSALRPMDVAAGRNPARALGISHAAVDPGARRLATRIDAVAEMEPRGPLDVAVRVAGDGPAWVTVAAVDVGILNLTGYRSPDPDGHYFGQRKLAVGIRDLYGRLIDGLNGAMGEVRSGGDAGAQARLQGDPPTEALVAFFSGPVEVVDGVAHARFDIPDFNGRVRLMAVAWSATGVGQAEAEVAVRDPVVVTASLPRFIAPGDETRLLLEFAHAAGPAGRMAVEVTGAAPFAIDLAEGGRARHELALTAGGAIRVALTTPDGRRLTKDLFLPVRALDPPIAVTSRFPLAAGQSFTATSDILSGLRPGASAVLAIGPIARFDAPGLLRALDLYPWGCTEQITSRALPLLYFDEMARLLGQPGEPEAGQRVREAIAAVLTNQTGSGAFGLWRAEAGDLWLDAYVTDFLSRARARGFAVPDIAFRAALANLRSQLSYAGDFEQGGAPYAYALMVLAREGAAGIDDLRYYADTRAEAFDTPLAAAQLGAALASYGDQTRADRLFARAVAMTEGPMGSPADSRTWRADYGSAARDAAGVLALAAEAASASADDLGLIARVAAGPAPGAASTQEAVWRLLATHALVDRPGAEGFTLNGAPVAGPLVRLLAAGSAPMTIRNGSGREEVLTLTAFGVPEVPGPAGGNGYTIGRSYYDLKGQPVRPDRVAAGTRLVAVLEIAPLAPAEARLLVTDPLPAGLEIDNPNLLRAGDITALDWLEVAEARHAEFREDRFLAQVDWREDASFRLAYMVRAVSPGRFHHPAASVEDMYRPEFRAVTGTGEMRVTP